MNGDALVPNHETLRHFEKIRLSNGGMDALMELFCIKVVGAGTKLGLKIGEKTGTDSTPIETHNDPDGTYNASCTVKIPIIGTFKYKILLIIL